MLQINFTCGNGSAILIHTSSKFNVYYIQTIKVTIMFEYEENAGNLKLLKLVRSNTFIFRDRVVTTNFSTGTNYRKACLILCEKGEVEEPWFGFNQEFFLTATDGRPLGWPPGGFPAPPGPYYCATGANKIVARDLMEAFYRYSSDVLH